MTATEQGKWRVTVENSSIIEMGAQEELIGTYTHEFDSLDAALEFAWEKYKTLHHKVTVEAPDGIMSEEELVRRYCAARSK
jgi:hypothetical protein